MAAHSILEHESVETKTHINVLFIDAVAERLGMSVRTIERRIRAGAFPIPELPRLDHRRRWSPTDVERWIATAATERRQPMRIVRGK